MGNSNLALQSSGKVRFIPTEGLDFCVCVCVCVCVCHVGVCVWSRRLVGRRICTGRELKGRKEDPLSH